MVPSLFIGPRTLLNDCNHSATAIFWRSAILDCETTFATTVKMQSVPVSGCQDKIEEPALEGHHCAGHGQRKVAPTPGRWATRFFVRFLHAALGHPC